MADANLSADTPQLMMEAANFDRISGELRGVLSYVESTAGALATHLNSPDAGLAAQQALSRFHEASANQIQLLTEISENIHQGGVQYDTADMHNMETLHQQMQL